MILKNLIYIFQSENYYFSRFFRFVYVHLAWWNLENRQKIVWTAKARLLWLVTELLFWIIVGIFFIQLGIIGFCIIPILIIILPFLVGLAFLIIKPLDMILKQKKINNARKIILTSKVKVIGIAGSYGKTSVKEILATILSQKFEVIKTPENINTDIGIADFIIKNKDKFKEGTIFVVEMGAYQKGEIKKICEMVKPLYSILTGINESHLERFGSLENIIEAKFEISQNTQELALFNFDDENLKKNYSRFAFKKSIGISKQDAQDILVRENFKGLKFRWEGNNFETSLLAQHNIALIMLCAKIAQEFLFSLDDISKGVAAVCPVKHRLEPIYNTHTDIMVIDDSYNGNLNGIKSGIWVLKQATGRKVVLTPGLVELGSRAQEIHEEIGELYAKNVDLVMLIKSKMVNFIIMGMKKSGFINYKVYKNTQEAHNDLSNILQKGDTIIFQNDLTDNYF
ncbi:MAG: UDP-N-acetylmuramoyl-tripeptide--D-alanyl-D-alanine ligase [Parcubacteria group bacterium]|jgi:UDP-N-acetylmuramoyl-tripeptide--D-alanyl-D-alanine ligase